jgi:hypothetical protein
MVQLTLIRKELELGEATRFSVLEIEAKVKEIELNLKKAVDNFEIARNRFKIQLRLDWRTPIEVLGDVENDFVLNAPDGTLSIDECVALAVRNRKEIESADVEHAVNTKSRRINMLYFFPRFSLGAGYSLSDRTAFRTFHTPREGMEPQPAGNDRPVGKQRIREPRLGESENANTRSRRQSAQANILDAILQKPIVKAGNRWAIEVESAIAQTAGIDWVPHRHGSRERLGDDYIADKHLALYAAQLEMNALKPTWANESATTSEAKRSSVASRSPGLKRAIRYLTTRPPWSWQWRRHRIPETNEIQGNDQCHDH